MEKKLITLVREEAKFLRDNLKSIEKRRIVFKNLRTTDATKCIYGLATGNCYSTRALTLISQGCKEVYKGSILNPKSAIKAKGIEKRRMYNLWSPIEIFLVKNRYNPATLKNLIRYIKGNSETLDI